MEDIPYFVPGRLDGGTWTPVTPYDLGTEKQPKNTERIRTYQQRYKDLLANMVPKKPSAASKRQHVGGRSGGSWHHISEVLGHGGNQVIFVNGARSAVHRRGLAERRGKKGGKWNHVQNVLCSGGNRIIFIDSSTLMSIHGDSFKSLPNPVKRWHKREPEAEAKVLDQDALYADMAQRRPWWNPGKDQADTLARGPDYHLPEIPLSGKKYTGVCTLKV